MLRACLGFDRHLVFFTCPAARTVGGFRDCRLLNLLVSTMRLRFVSALCVALVAQLCCSARIPQPISAPLPLNFHAAARQSVKDDIPRVNPEFNINSGGPAVGRFVAEAPEWIVGETGVFVTENALIGGAEDKNLPMYLSHRFGNDGSSWGYDIPVMEPGTYGCTVHFAETDSESFTDGKRVFSLYMATAHGDPVAFENIDIIAELGGAEFTVLTKTPEEPLVITGILSIRVVPSVGDAIISGVTCERLGDLPDGLEPDYETDPKLPIKAVEDTDSPTSDGGVSISGTEININCGGPAVGRFLAEDYNWIRGTTSSWLGPDGAREALQGAEDKNVPALTSQRYGVDQSTWGYDIPIDMPGIYDCSLHFAETFDGAFSVGARVFDIMIMDRKLEDVDIFREGTEFTSVVKTFTDLELSESLKMALIPKVSDAFISAITCEKTGELPDSALPGGSPEESVSPEVMPTDVPTPSVVPDASPSSSPSPSPVAVVPSPDATESELPSPDVVLTTEPLPDASGDALESSPEDEVVVDTPLRTEDGEDEQTFDLKATVTGDGRFTKTMSTVLKKISGESTETVTRWALLTVTESPAGVSGRQSDEERSYDLQLQAVMPEDEKDGFVDEYTAFIRDSADEKFKEEGVDNLSVTLATTANNTAQGEESGGSNNTVAIVLGSVLGGLALVAFIAFFVVRGRRGGEPNAAAFDAPPPALTESERSSVMERSETANSVEYIDDDSTFTAATSRAGDHHVDQVGFVKDVFGRGTGEGTHGTS